MAKTETMPTRSPRGTKPVSEAFFAALASIPMASRALVAKAAQAMIRDELKIQRDRAKAAGAKQKAAQPAAAKTLIATKKSAPAKAPLAVKPLAKAKTAVKKNTAPELKAKIAEAAPQKLKSKKNTAAKAATKPAETSPAA